MTHRDMRLASDKGALQSHTPMWTVFYIVLSLRACTDRYATSASLRSTGVTAENIAEWNQLGPNIGRPAISFMFKKMVTEVYAGAPYTGVESVFD